MVSQPRLRRGNALHERIWEVVPSLEKTGLLPLNAVRPKQTPAAPEDTVNGRILISRDGETAASNYMLRPFSGMIRACHQPAAIS